MKNFFVCILFITYCFFPSEVSAVDSSMPAIENGIIDLRGWNFQRDGSINLDGEWNFFVRKFLVSDLHLQGIDNPDGSLTVQGGHFNHFNLFSGEKLDSKTYATYKLELLLPDKPVELSLYLNMSGSAHHLYLVESNGAIKDLGGRGTPGKSFETSKPCFFPYFAHFTASGKITLLWEFSNFYQYFSRFRYIPVIGTTRDIMIRPELYLVYVTFGAVIISCLYNLVIFVFYTKETPSIWLAILGIIILIVTFLQHSLFLSFYEFLEGDPTFYIICQKTKLICTGAIPLVIIKFFSELLSKEDSTITDNRFVYFVHKIIFLSSFICIVLVVFLSTYRSTQFLNYFYAVYVFSVFWGLVLLGWQLTRKVEVTILLTLVVFLFLVGSTINDILFSLQIVKTGIYFQFGFVLFIISQSAVLARFSAISREKNEQYRITIENQSKTLEQLNLNLEKKVEERTSQLKKAEALSNSLLEHSPDVIIAVDEQLTVFYCNRIETDQPDPFGKSLSEFLEPSAYMPVQRPLQSLFENKKTGMIEVQAGQTMPKQWHEYRFAGITGEDGSIKEAMIIITDITERKQAEQELEVVQKELIEKAHRAGKGDIAADILHNVGNSLNSLKLSADLAFSCVQDNHAFNGFISANKIIRETEDLELFLKKDSKAVSLMKYYLLLEEELSKDRDAIEKNLKDVVKFVSEISATILSQRDYVGQESIEERVVFSDTIEEALNMQTDLIIKNNISVKKSYDQSSSGTIQKPKLMYVLLNLIENAIDSMKSKPLEDRLLTVSSEEDEKSTTILISDTGEGIVRDNLTKIFTRGFTTKPSGHGFGLHNCANYMNEMKAGIFVDSKGSGKGTTFSLVFSKTSTS